MSHLFGLERIEAAVDTLAAGPERLQKRLAKAFLEHLTPVDPDKDLPAELRPRSGNPARAAPFRRLGRRCPAGHQHDDRAGSRGAGARDCRASPRAVDSREAPIDLPRRSDDPLQRTTSIERLLREPLSGNGIQMTSDDKDSVVRFADVAARFCRTMETDPVSTAPEYPGAAPAHGRASLRGAGSP